MRGPIGLLALLLFVLPACAKHSAVCLTFEEKGHGDVSLSAGPWGEVGQVNMTGPASYKRIPDDFKFDPCSGVEMPKDAPPI